MPVSLICLTDEPALQVVFGIWFDFSRRIFIGRQLNGNTE